MAQVLCRQPILGPFLPISLVFFCLEEYRRGRGEERKVSGWRAAHAAAASPNSKQTQLTPVRNSLRNTKSNCRNRAMSRSIAILCLVSSSLVSCLFVVLLPKALLPCSSCLVLSSSISSIHPWFFSSWQSFCQVAFAPTRDQKPARQKSTASGWSFRFSS